MATPKGGSILSTRPFKNELERRKYMKKLWQSRSTGEVKVYCVGGFLKCHRMVLNDNKIFRQLLRTSNSSYTSDLRIYVADSHVRTIQTLLKFVYLNRFEVPNRASLVALLKSAFKYRMKELKDICFRFLIKKVDLKTAGRLAIMAYEYNAPVDCRLRLKNFILRNQSVLMKYPFFRQLIRLHRTLFKYMKGK